MDKKFSFSGIASNPASGINNIDLNVAGADGAGMSSDSSGVTKKEMITLLQKIVHAGNENLQECKTDLEEIIERVTRPEYKKRISQIMTAIDMAQDPRKKTKDPSTGQYDPTAQQLASRMMRKLSHLENEEEHKNQHTAGNKTMSFNNREAQVKKKKKTRGNPFRVLMGKVGKLLDHGIEKKDIVRYLAKQKFWGNETIERAVDIVRDYNKKLIKTTTMFLYEIVYIICMYSIVNKEVIQTISEFLGFEVASNFILLILVVIGLWANYVNQTKVRHLEMQIVKLSQFIAITGSKFDK